MWLRLLLILAPERDYSYELREYARTGDDKVIRFILRDLDETIRNYEGALLVEKASLSSAEEQIEQARARGKFVSKDQAARVRWPARKAYNEVLTALIKTKVERKLLAVGLFLAKLKRG